MKQQISENNLFFSLHHFVHEKRNNWASANSEMRNKNWRRGNKIQF